MISHLIMHANSLIENILNQAKRFSPFFSFNAFKIDSIDIQSLFAQKQLVLFFEDNLIVFQWQSQIHDFIHIHVKLKQRLEMVWS